MRTFFFCLAGLLAVTVLGASLADAKKKPRQLPRISIPLDSRITPPPGLVDPPARAAHATAAADTFVLLYSTFDDASGNPDPMGWTSVDRTAQVGTFFHVADSQELDGGESGNLMPLAGQRSMWCGLAPGAPEFCSYATLPGYGNAWNQELTSAPLSGDSVTITYKVFFDSEVNYDGTTLEYTFDNGENWHRVAVADTFGGREDIYEGTMSEPYITETFSFGSPGATTVQFRFHFSSDQGWSDEDGLWPSDGAIILDDIAIETWTNGVVDQTNMETFETTPPGSNTAGIWTASQSGQAFGDYAALHEAGYLLQEDPCDFVTGAVWGFFTDPWVANYWCHQPEPRRDVGVWPYGIPAEEPNGLWEDQIYLSNSIRSPVFANTGRGDRYRLSFLVYEDLPLEALQFYFWGVRGFTDGCAGPWQDYNYVYYGPSGKQWNNISVDFLGLYADPDADSLQVRFTVADMCGYWCGVYAYVECHRHAPLFDNVRVERIHQLGPEISAHDLDLFHDTFAEDGTLTGTARADAAVDVNGYAFPIVPGDSVSVSASGAGSDPYTGIGPAVYAYVALWPQEQTGKTEHDMESPEMRAGVGKRYPFVGKVLVDDVSWACYRMDSVVSEAERFCFDLNDALFTPGDTICYFFGADGDGVAQSGDEIYWHRLLNGQDIGNVTGDIAVAAASPCEFTVLPAGGYNRGGDVLYVDATDGRGGPAQIYFDNTFELMGLKDRIDRYDVLAPASNGSNGLASRVADVSAQITDVYKIIIWSSGIFSTGIGDGTTWGRKSDDYALLYAFLDQSDSDPGLYISGSNASIGWANASGAGIDLRSDFMSHTLYRSDHVRSGESVSPTLTATGSAFIHGGVADRFVAHGGCPYIRGFDMMIPTGSAAVEFPYPATGSAAVVSQETMNSAGTLARVVLSGFGLESIRDLNTEFPRARGEHLTDIFIKFAKLVPVVSDAGSPDYVNALEPNFPNPFNPSTTIRYSIRECGHVSLKVYNTAGQLVATLIDDVQSPETVKPVEWHGMNDVGQSVSSGVYFYRLVTDGFVQTRKMVLLK